MLIIMIRPKPRTGKLKLNASGHIKRCDVKTQIVDQKSVLQWMQLKVTVNLCPLTKIHCCTGCNQNHGHKLELKTDEQLLICENN